MIRRRLVSGTISNCVGKLVSIGAWFFLTPFVLARLGADAYALWVLVGAIASYGLLLEHGFGGAVIKYIAEHVAREERDQARAVVASAVWLYAALALVALLISAALAPLLPPLIHADPAQHDTASSLIALTGLNIACAIAFTPATAVLRGLHRYDLHNAVVAVNAVVEAVLVAGVLFGGGGLIHMMLAMIAVNAATGILAAALVARVAPDLRLRLRGATRESFRRLAVFSGALFPIEAGRRLQSRADGFVIAAVHTLGEVTPFALARRLAELSELAAVQFLRVVMPVASELHAGDERLKLRQLYIVSSRVALAISVPITVTLTIAGESVLTMWVGAEYARDSDVLMILAVATLLGTSQWPAAEILQGMSRHRIVAITTCTSGAASILLAIALLPWFGLAGVALAALVPAAVSSLLVVIPFASRIMQVSSAAMVRDVWAPALVPGGAAALVLWTLAGGAAVDLPRLTLALSAAMGTYAAAYLAMPSARAERRLLADMLMLLPGRHQRRAHAHEVDGHAGHERHPRAGAVDPACDGSRGRPVHSFGQNTTPVVLRHAESGAGEHRLDSLAPKLGQHLLGPGHIPLP